MLAVFAGQATRAEAAAPLSAAASHLIAEGERHFTALDFVRAHAAFERAYRETGSLVAGIKSARALVRLGRLLEACERYETIISAEVVTKGESDPAALRQEAALELQQLVVRVPRVGFAIIGAAPESVELALDGVAVPSPPPAVGVPVNPGRHRVSGSANGRSVERYVDLGEGDVTTVTLRFGAPMAGEIGGPAAPERADGLGGQRLAGVITFGVGVAALVTGGFIGWSALQDEDALSDRCPDRRCPESLRSEIDAYEAKKLIALAGVGAGGALAATGAVLYLTGPSRRAEPRVGFYLGPSGAGLRGAF